VITRDGSCISKPRVYRQIFGWRVSWYSLRGGFMVKGDVGWSWADAMKFALSLYRR